CRRSRRATSSSPRPRAATGTTAPTRRPTTPTSRTARAAGSASLRRRRADRGAHRLAALRRCALVDRQRRVQDDAVALAGGLPRDVALGDVRAHALGVALARRPEAPAARGAHGLDVALREGEVLALRRQRDRLAVPADGRARRRAGRAAGESPG